MQINGRTRIFGIIGHPVAHSLSPAMQNAALAAAGLDGVYVPFDVHPDHLPSAVAGLRALGVAGFNVTIPHKSAILPCLDQLDDSAAVAGAVNTVVNRNGRLIGYNTDGAGLLRSLAEDLQFCPGAGRILLIGAGGAARGAVAALCRAGASRVDIINRNHERAQELALSLGGYFPASTIRAVATPQELQPLLQDTELIINTTSLGMHDEPIPFLQVQDLPQQTSVYDMVYTPAVTPFLRDALERGLQCANGLGMLVGQGECAFEIWTGNLPPSGVMKSVFSSTYRLTTT